MAQRKETQESYVFLLQMSCHCPQERMEAHYATIHSQSVFPQPMAKGEKDLPYL
jgi:hypothetical protein